ncbi:MAG TPA: maltose alpha-D-glucosyltransferase [Candidatus Binataceae bacterium]|nr:maltose alpha-D-glucosyltransferase [Candidatus Binataceae bacterium]
MPSNHSNNGGPPPLWYKDAIFYELRVRSFYDGNGDGVGDFAGLTSKLDYLRSLGVTALWLLPFYPSPMRDDGYDISDYTSVHPDCGTLRDFRAFLREAHERGLRVITELVLNHTSDQHRWFQRARRSAPGNHRDFYLWSDSAEKFREARVIFQDFEPSNWTWDPVAKAYYFHRFYAHQPDLNYDNPAVRREIFRVVSFWLGMGVDGLRLDAVPYLFKREGTSCENLPETHAFLSELRKYIDERFPNRMLLAEANQWPEDAVTYLAEGKECHMAFHFPLMPRIFMSVRMEDRYPLTDIWAQTPEIGPSCQWALFLRNHDELTLEMVTDEERDYMYRAFAQESRMRINLGIRRRLAPLLGNNRRTMELNNALLFSLPGTPIIYYGDEIGMGDNVYLGDRDGVRTPMQWSADRNAGFSTANPQRLILPVNIDYEYHYQTINVEAQESNRHSLLWWMRRLIALRKEHKALGRGSMEFLSPHNPHVLAFIRGFENERILVVANLSRFVQYVELDLAQYKGMTPVELFGRTPFPAIGDLPYLLTLGPHAFVWFALEASQASAATGLAPYAPPRIDVSADFEGMLQGSPREALERALPLYLPHCRWFRSKARILKSASIKDVLPLGEELGSPQLLLIEVEYLNAESEQYLLPLAIAAGDRVNEIRANSPERVLAELASSNDGSEAILYDAVVDSALAQALLDLVERHRRHRGRLGQLAGQTTRTHEHVSNGSGKLDSHLLRVEQSNNSIVYSDRYILKLYRRLDNGLNPDLEVGRFLTERAHFEHAPRTEGWIEYRASNAAPRTLALLQSFVANEGDTWEFTLGELRRFFEVAATRQDAPRADKSPIEMLEKSEPDPLAAELMAPYLASARLLGQRVAELHIALSSSTVDPDFAPEPYTTLYRRSAYQSMRNQLSQVLRLANGVGRTMAKEDQDELRAITSRQGDLIKPFEKFLNTRISVSRVRTHGDLHLGQVLHTGKDFMIIDFEGEPGRPISERRHKRAALRDVAGMLRSYHYAAFTALTEELKSKALGSVNFARMEPWASFWWRWASWSFLQGYLKIANDISSLVPETRDELRVLLDAFTMEKAIYELGYELNNRPDWLIVPLFAIKQLIGSAPVTA